MHWQSTHLWQIVVNRGDMMATTTEKTVMKFMRDYLYPVQKRISKKTNMRNLTFLSDDPLAYVKLTFELEDTFGVFFEDEFWNKRKLPVSDVAEAIDKALGVHHYAPGKIAAGSGKLSQAG